MLEPHKKDLQAALTAHRAGRIDVARSIYEQLHDHYPRNFDVVHLLGLCCFQSGDVARGAALIGEAVRLNPGSAAAHNNLGNIHKAMGALQEAKACFDKAIGLKPDYPEALVNRGAVLHVLGLAEPALPDFDAALALQPKYPDAHVGRGLALKTLKRLDDALGAFDAALALNPRHLEALANKGTLLTDSGRPADALALLENAIRIRPDLPSSHYNLGNAHLALARGADALASYDRAISLRQSYPEAYNNRGTALKELGRLEEAVTSYDTAISQKPAYPEAYNNRGNALKELGRYEQALTSYDKAISLNPADAEAHGNRGNALRELDRLTEAVASYDTAIALRPVNPEVFNNRGTALKDLGRLAEAVASYDMAISQKPGYALAWLGLARIESELGRFAEAEEKYRTARQLDPASAAPLCGIAEVRTFAAGDPLVEEIAERLSRASLPDQDRALLHHAYAKICNDLGRHDDAAEHFLQGKKLLKSRFSIARHEAGYAAVKQLFTRQFFAERSGFGLADERPVFIVGMPRSGTTLIEQILASHHLVEGLGELPDLPMIVKNWCGGLNDPERFARAVTGLTPDDVKNMAAAYLETHQRSRKPSIRLIDKRPHNYEWLGLLAIMLPKARIIHCHRDPLDNCVSMFMQNFNESHGYNQDLSVLGQYYRSYERLMTHWSEVLPVRVHDCCYENVVNDLEACARSLVAFLGLAWDPNCLDYHRQDRQVSTPSRWQVRQPLYASSVGRWRRYDRHLGPLKAALGPGDAA